jgi:hypothetical protein
MRLFAIGDYEKKGVAGARGDADVRVHGQGVEVARPAVSRKHQEFKDIRPKRRGSAEPARALLKVQVAITNGGSSSESCSSSHHTGFGRCDLEKRPQRPSKLT